VKVMGAKKLRKQLQQMSVTTHEALLSSTRRTVALGVRKAKAIAPVDTGDLVSKFSGHTMSKDGNTFGFINFHDGTASAAIKFGAVNYGRKGSRTSSGTRLKNSVASTGQTSGYHIRETIELIISERHKRAVTRSINKAIKDAVK